MKLTFYVVMLSACSSCLSLEAVQQYASESAEGTERFSEIDLTFQALCQRKRQWRDLRQSRVLRTYQDSCLLQQQADSALMKMQRAVQEYLMALYAVSSGERVYYSLNPVKEALTGSGLIQVEEKTINAYQNLLELLATASTEAYRRRQVQQLVDQAHPPLTALIDQLTFVVDEAFREAIGQQQEMLYLNTLELADSARTFVERQSLLQQYIEEVRYYEQQLQLLDTYATILATVKDGHQALYDRRRKLHRQETVTTMVFYLAELRRLQTAFEKKVEE